MKESSFPSDRFLSNQFCCLAEKTMALTAKMWLFSNLIKLVGSQTPLIGANIDWIKRAKLFCNLSNSLRLSGPGSARINIFHAHTCIIGGLRYMYNRRLHLRCTSNTCILRKFSKSIKKHCFKIKAFVIPSLFLTSCIFARPHFLMKTYTIHEIHFCF